MTKLAPTRVLVADCPWKFGDKLPGTTRGASKNYRTMTVDQLCAYPLPVMAQDAVLFFWRVASMQREALEVIDAWGDWTVKTELVWSKVGESGPSFGMGRILRGAHETCLVATRGKFKPANLSERTIFFAERARHSEKPTAFYELVERLAPLGKLGEHVEFFGRRERAGWIQYGEQMPGRE